MPRGLAAALTSFLEPVSEEGFQVSSSVGAGSAARRLIFQDVDGVLNTYVPSTSDLDGQLLKNLKQVLDQTGADLVISSQWRKHPNHLQRLRQALQGAGISADRIVGQTSSLCSATECRAREIADFLHAHPSLTKDGLAWAAVDDVDLESQDPTFMHGHFVKTDPLQGLTRDRAEVLSATLQSQRPPGHVDATIAAGFSKLQ
eukprot:TRINITY_DN46229_c0_g1_i1.p1 TRINITY_DN46229_c0_g1~~TRINITY_DN46229_c0_g1_i1.p1  ORF type:complete len:202 (+),score=38.66 TRINITY_DN46229_c0_g1_i1:61-666(+)